MKCIGLPSYHQVAELLGINTKQETTKDTQTIGALEGCHVTINTSLKKASVEPRKKWHKILPITFLKHNKSYHSSIDCEPSRVFRGRVLHNILDRKVGLRINPNKAPTTDSADELLRRTEVLYDKTKKKRHALLHQIKKYYNKKSKRWLLHTSIKAYHRGSKIIFRNLRSIRPHLVEKKTERQL